MRQYLYVRSKVIVAFHKKLIPRYIKTREQLLQELLVIPAVSSQQSAVPGGTRVPVEKVCIVFSLIITSELIRMLPKRPRPTESTDALIEEEDSSVARPFETSLTLRSALKALDSCFHFVFFGALVKDNDNGETTLRNNETEKKNLPIREKAKLFAVLEAFLDEDLETGTLTCRCSSINRKGNQEDRTYFSLGQATNISHCQQLETWDCGITCIQMILRWLRSNGNAAKNDTFGGSMPLTAHEILDRHELRKAIATDSIWTIDLIWILNKVLSRELALQTSTNSCANYSSRRASYLFSSRRLGVDESYRAFKYYKRSFRIDEKRVKQLFHSAHDQKFPMVQMSNLDFDVVMGMISRDDVVAMALVDNNVFRRYDEEPELDWDGNYVYEPFLNSFSGHYVLLCGISDEKCHVENAKGDKAGDRDEGNYCIVMKNPGSTQSAEFITPKLFEAAWKAKGTDNDIIFIRSFEERIKK